MTIKSISTLLILSICALAPFRLSGQAAEWITMEEKDYSIEYPENWELNTDGEMGTTFILFSETSSEEDLIKENVNLLIQDIAAFEIDLNQYVEISEQQIKTMITDSKLLSSDRLNKDDRDFHRVVYTGKQGVFTLKWVQYYWVHNGSAYVLTFTGDVSEYEDYKETSERMLNSFKLN